VSIYPQDTIVAIATPQGEGAVGIVRLSGPSALKLAASHTALDHSLLTLDSYRIRRTYLKLDERETDDILVFLGRAPKTYTGEDTVEFQCHGSPILLNRLVGSLVSAGARAADPGEFTRRAFLNGRIDLTQAEAVADLVSARTDVGLDSAFFQLRGGLKERFQLLASELRQTKTLLEAELDFSEDVTIDPKLVADQLRAAVDILESQIKSYDTGKLIRAGASVTLCGKPNVGKSSLLNALLGQDRSIVTDVAGTTRDTIEDAVEIGGLAITLTDTAGLRETEDPIEREGNRRSNLAAAASDLVLLVCDGSVGPSPVDSAFLSDFSDALLILNKADIGSSPEWEVVSGARETIRLSALTGMGLDELREGIRSELGVGEQVRMEGVTNARHVEALKQTQLALKRAMSRILDGSPGEIVSFEIDEGLSALAGVIGETTAQDILDAIFSQFCIGK
jgi:tRNA modification GTPase